MCIRDSSGNTQPADQAPGEPAQRSTGVDHPNDTVWATGVNGRVSAGNWGTSVASVATLTKSVAGPASVQANVMVTGCPGTRVATVGVAVAQLSEQLGATVIE